MTYAHYCWFTKPIETSAQCAAVTAPGGGPVIEVEVSYDAGGGDCGNVTLSLTAAQAEGLFHALCGALITQEVPAA